MAAQLQPQSSPLAPAPPPASPPNVDSILAAQPKRLEELNEDVADTDKKVSDISAKEGAMRMPELKEVPQPTAPQTDPAKIWGSSAMLFAALGGLMTRRPLVTAMNAATKVFQAYKQNDIEAAKTAFDSWKIANENAMKIADFQQKQYKEALDGYEKDKTGALASLRAKMVAFQDTTGVQQLDIHGIQGAQQHIIELKRLNNEMDKTKADLEEKNDQHQALMTARAANTAYKQAQASGDPAKIKQAKDNLDAAMEDIHTINAAYGKGGGTSGSFRSLPAMVANKYAQEHPDATAEDMENFAANYGEKIKATRDFGTGKQGDTARSLNVSVSHLDTLRELGRALDNGDVTRINAAKQRFAEEFGVPAPTNFDTAKSIVADEVAKGVIGGSTAQNDRETLAAALRRERSFKATEGSIDTFQKLLGGQLGGLRQQYERTTGNKDFDQAFLSPSTRKALEKDPKAVPVVSTQEEYDALPSGAIYTESDGKKYKKP